jgi:hypothetical protein
MDNWERDMLRAATKAAVALERIANALEPLAEFIKEALEEEKRG